MKVLSLFDGISCGMVALERAGIPVERYVAYEIDKYAIQVSKKNYPQIEQMGDVFDGDYTQYKGFDLLLGGSPCTFWSIAKSGREITPDGMGGKLFMEYVRALKESECKYFLYENNFSIHKDIKSYITEQLGVEPVVINSALVSAQNRKRCYWTNIPNVTQPDDRNVKLSDVMENEVDEKYIYKDKTLYDINLDKSQCCKIDIKGMDIVKRVYNPMFKAPTATTCGGGNRQIKVLISLSERKHVVRKLLPLEYERLQTLPDNYTEGLSDTQRYKGIGNGWTVDVIAHILKGLKGDKMITEKNDYTDCINSIRNFVPDREMLEQLAEEAAELAQAAIKVIRAGEMAKGLPTPVKYDEAFKNLVEEASDIRLILNIIGIHTTKPQENPKALRWYNRLIKSYNSTEG